MASCCTVTYVVVAGIAAVLAIVACSVPLFVITDNNDGYDGGDGAKEHSGFVASGHVGRFGTKASSERPLRREASPLSTRTDLKCPLFGQCTGTRFPTNIVWPPSTRDFLGNYGCDGNLDGARALAVIAVMGAGATTLLAVVGISRMQGPRVRLYKFGCVFLGGIGWVCGAVGFNVQLSIRRCLEDSYGFVQLYNGDFMVMVSAIVTAIFTAILFFATISMLSSWWCGCCGDQPGSYYVNYGPGQQGPYQQQQQQYAYGQLLVAGAVQGYPGQQPVMGSPTGQLQPQQYAPAPGTAYGQPTQQYGYQQAPQYAQYPQQQQPQYPQQQQQPMPPQQHQQAYQQAPQYAQYPQQQQPQYQQQQQQQPMPPPQQQQPANGYSA